MKDTSLKYTHTTDTWALLNTFNMCQMFIIRCKQSVQGVPYPGIVGGLAGDPQVSPTQTMAKFNEQHAR